jgi:transposase-like protein
VFKEDVKWKKGRRWPTTGSGVGPLSAKQRWSVPRKREVALRLLRGESVAVLSRELGVEIYRLEKWRDKALAGIEAALREREGDPLKQELDAALKQIGELTMTIELLRARIEKPGPFAKGRSRR